MSEALVGRCLCGAVRVEAERHEVAVSLCHCALCRRWAGGAMAGFEAEVVRAEGPVRRFASSPFAERAWCESCGTQLWFRERDRAHELSPGLFDEAAAWPTDREVYADRAPAWLRLAGDHPRITAAVYEARHPHV